MISRNQSLKRDMQTGVILTHRWLSGRSGIFKRRSFTWIQATVSSLILIVPISVICMGGTLYAYFVLVDMEAAERMLFVWGLLLAATVWITKGVCSNELGGQGSETD